MRRPSARAVDVRVWAGAEGDFKGAHLPTLSRASGFIKRLLRHGGEVDRAPSPPSSG